MKYFMIVSSGLDNPALDEAAMAEAKQSHLAYLNEAVVNGTVLLTGPRIGAVGGCMVMKAESYDKALEFSNGDPFAIVKIRESIIFEFNPHDYQDFLNDWIEK